MNAGDSESGIVLSAIIKSKLKLYAALNKVKGPSVADASVGMLAQSNLVPPAVNTPIVSAADASVGMLAPYHEFLKRKPGEITSEATAHLPITFVPAVSEQPMGFVSTSPSLAVLRSKKRQKNKKSKKGLHTDVQ